MSYSTSSKVTSVRNPESIWINSKVFCEEANHFKENGYYCSDPIDSPSWVEYWTEQQKRCIEGYTVGGVKITGHHYNYLNFTQIKKFKKLKGDIGNKVVDFPDFWDGDYNYFWAKEIAQFGITPEQLTKLNLSIKPSLDHLNGGFHMIVGKSRRKGYSFKNASICANIYNTVRNSTTLIGAQLKEYLYPEGTMAMASEFLNFYNEHTGWGKARDFKDKEDYRRASYAKTLDDGLKIEAGYMSSIRAISFNDNADAARGKDATLILFEEAGKFPNLKQAYIPTEATTRSGRMITGQIIIFGTGGDMEDGTADFADMFYNPESFYLMPFTNIWDDESENTNCGFFHPMYWNNEGFSDAQGNSDNVAAKKYENDERDKLRKRSGGINVLQQRVQEFPHSPSEAFLTVSTNDFPIIELRNRLNVIIKEQLHLKFGQAGYLYRDELGKAKFKPDLNNILKPNWFREVKDADKSGAVVIYEYPIENSPRGLYKIGYDPYVQDDGTSLASIWVKKGNYQFSATRDTIVATWTGRLSDVDAAHKIFEMLCELYNSEGMHENMTRDVVSYFQRRNKLHLLATQPDQVISIAVKRSGVSRTYGCHMNDTLKDLGAKYTKQWLLKQRDMDENGRILTNIDFIYDPGFIEELILWNKKGNFDRVSAWFMVMIQDQEEELGFEYGNVEIQGIMKDLIDLKQDLFKKR